MTDRCLDGCGKQAEVKGRCRTHYKRHWRQSRAGVSRPCRLGDGRPQRAKGLCSPHYQKLLAYGDPLYEAERGQPGATSPHWKGALVTYQGAHNRVRAKWGSAALWDCVRCGQPAQDWAYRGGDPAERQGAGGAYSGDPDFYEPLCRACHSGKRPTVAEVMDALMAGESQRSIARRFGVDGATVRSRIVQQRQADVAAGYGRKFPGHISQTDAK